MRQIGTLSDEQQAQTFVDFLLTRGIASKIDAAADGVSIWIREEDQLADARAELARFQQDPAAEYYQAASTGARQLRQENQRRETEHRRNMIDMRRRWSARGGARNQPLTMALIGLSVVVTLLSHFGDPKSRITQALKMERIYAGPHGDLYMERGLKAVRHGEVWRVVTPILLHGGTLHLLFNMIWLYELGGMIESRRGTFALAWLVLVTGILSNFGQYFWEGGNFLGMSGVVYGLFGYVWMKSRFQPQLGLFVPPNTVFTLVIWFFICFLPFMHIANGAHAAGLIVGIALGYAPVAWKKLTRG